jgi:hypothetical protein
MFASFFHFRLVLRMYYSHFLSGVEWSQRTIGGDEMLVGGTRYDARLRLKDSNGVPVRTIGKFFPASSSGYPPRTFALYRNCVLSVTAHRLSFVLL